MEEERKKWIFGDSETSLPEKSLKDHVIIRFTFLKDLYAVGKTDGGGQSDYRLTILGVIVLVLN